MAFDDVVVSITHVFLQLLLGWRSGFFYFFPPLSSGMLKTVQCKLIAFLIAVFKVLGLRPHMVQCMMKV